MCAVVKHLHIKKYTTAKSEEFSVIYRYIIVIENIKLSVVTIIDGLSKSITKEVCTSGFNIDKEVVYFPNTGKVTHLNNYNSSAFEKQFKEVIQL